MIYNAERKERFIMENYTNEGTRLGIRKTFEKIRPIEEQYNTDVCEFNRNQLIEMLGVLDCTTTESLSKEYSKIRRYVEWCAAEGYCLPNLVISSIYRKDLIKYINKHAHENMFIKNRDEFYKYCDMVYNPQEQVIPVLIYEGICGKNFEEIKNLKKEDFNYDNNTILIRRDNRTLIINDIDVRSMNIIKDAIEQEIYYKGNGETESRTKTIPLEESDYIVKRVKRKDNVECISTVTIDARISLFKKWTGLYWLNAKNIFFSGMFDRLQSKEVSGAELTKQDYINVCIRFGWSANRWNILKDKYLQFKEIMQD